jgi:hypothetical protein
VIGVAAVVLDTVPIGHSCPGTTRVLEQVSAQILEQAACEELGLTAGNIWPAAGVSR